MNKKKAVLKYKPNSFDVLVDGDHVICAVSKKREEIKDIKIFVEA